MTETEAVPVGRDPVEEQEATELCRCPSLLATQVA